MRSAVVHPSKHDKHYWQPPCNTSTYSWLSWARTVVYQEDTASDPWDRRGSEISWKVGYLVTFLQRVSLYVWYPSYHSSCSSCSVHYNKCSLSVLNIIPTNTSHKFVIVMENVTNVTIFVTGNFIQWYQGERLQLYNQPLSSAYFCS